MIMTRSSYRLNLVNLITMREVDNHSATMQALALRLVRDSINESLNC